MRAVSLTPLYRIFSYSRPLDYGLNLAAIIAAIGSGIALAVTELIFGNLTNLIHDFSLATISKEEFLAGVNQETLYFVYAFIGRFICSYIFTVTSPTVLFTSYTRLMLF